MATKSVFISYVPADKDVAMDLKQLIEEYIGDTVWVRDIDLETGELVIEALDTAISEAKWFVTILSTKAAESGWFKTEANIATMRSIEALDFQIITIRIDKGTYGRHLNHMIDRASLKISLGDTSSRQDELLKVVDHIDQTESTVSDGVVYVDRGSDTDRFALLERRNKIIFVLGLAGIGKTSFVINSVARSIRRRPIHIQATKGHSGDLFARQLIQKTHLPQPLNANSATEQELMQIAVESIKQRSDRQFVFVDNGELALDAANRLQPFLEDFLVRHIASDVAVPVIIATTRLPDLPAGLASYSDMLRINGLETVYIREAIDLWLVDLPDKKIKEASSDLDKLAKLASGHPLAARMIASYLRVNKTPQQLLLGNHRRMFELKLAEHILSNLNYTLLGDLHQLILQVLAVIQAPVTIDDLLSFETFKNIDIEVFHEAFWHLSDWLLIEQTGDLVSLHGFISTYFEDQISDDEFLKDVAKDVGAVCYSKALDTQERLKLEQAYAPESDATVQLSNSLFRYALLAGRLLRRAGREDLAEKLPIQIKGTLREMVFYFYQTKGAQNYHRALEYAERWLEINPADLEVMLYQARCYRNFRNPDSLEKAKEITNLIERRDFKSDFAARLYREKAMIADMSGNVTEAKNYYRKGIKISQRRSYPENHAGLARLLLREIQEGFDSTEISRKAEEAVALLEEARKDNATFDRYHFGTYVEALLFAGKDELAESLVEYSLKERPDDERLNYAMAEILRKRGAFELAEDYARKAVRGRAQKAPLTLANIYYAQGLEANDSGDQLMAREKFEAALASLDKLRPLYGYDEEVGATVRAKILRAMGDNQGAIDAVAKYVSGSNPYTLYEQAKGLLWYTSCSEAKNDYGHALAYTREALQLLQNFRKHHRLPDELTTLLTEVIEREDRLKTIVNNTDLSF